MNSLIKLAAFSILILFTACGIPYPVLKPQEHIEMLGRVFVDSKLPARYKINKIIAIRENGDTLGETTPHVDGANISWSLPVVAEENSIGTFWVEISDGISNILYYNGGSDERFISGGQYDLTVDQDNINIPIGSYKELTLIGKDSMHPSSANYVLIRDISASGDWEPLCQNGSEPFTGIFDGHNNTISGLKFVDKGSWQYLGLFGYVQGSPSEQVILRNLNLEISNTELQLSEVNEQCFGVLAGYAEDTVIDKVTVNGSKLGLTIKKASGGNFYIGGIVGKIADSIYSTVSVSKISRSSTLFTIEVDADNTGSGYLGGLVGYAKSFEGGISISNCYGTGLVAISNLGRDTYAGGILGYHDLSTASSMPVNSIIEKSYARGNVSVFGNADTYITAAGGIVGGSNVDGAAGLAGTRSCALMDSVSADGLSVSSASKLYAGGFSGDQLTDEDGCFQLKSMKITPDASASPAVNVTPVDKSALTEKWFNDSEFWDFSLTWQWDAQAGYPKFLWQ
jgi:hypothetical protein